MYGDQGWTHGLRSSISKVVVKSLEKAGFTVDTYQKDIVHSASLGRKDVFPPFKKLSQN